VARSDLKGPARELAAHAVFLGHADGVLRLGLSPEDGLLNTPASSQALARALAPALGAMPQLRFEASAPAGAETLRQRSDRARDARQDAAEAAFLADPGVQHLIRRHGATLVPDSIRPHDE
jgi:DNA polymerase-3 subunit gamma/tau